MALTVKIRRPICSRLVMAVLCVLTSPLALAQHPIARPIGGAPHLAPPPVYRAPAPLAPVYRSPILAPRISTFRSAGSAARFIPWRPVHRFPPLLVVYNLPFFWGEPFWGFNCGSPSCELFWPWMFDYTTVSSPGPINYVAQPYEAPPVEYGEEAPEMPELYLKDGSILSVTDYWLIDDQLHFTIVQEYGAKPEEQAIPFEALDLQKTVDVNTRRGFRFMLRNEPFEQYMRDHPEGPPPALTPSHP